MFKVLFILIFSLAECYGHGLCQAPERHLGGCWEDAQNVDLGYLWFEKSTPRHHRNALDFCKDRDSFLVEIFNHTQQIFLEGRILNIDASHTKWWTGGKYQRETKEWIWMNSSQPVGNFVWFRDPQDNPSHEIYLCLVYDQTLGDNYVGETCQDEEHHTICQRM